jgi:hypothetical protein
VFNQYYRQLYERRWGRRRRRRRSIVPILVNNDPHEYTMPLPRYSVGFPIDKMTESKERQTVIKEFYTKMESQLKKKSDNP